MQAWTGLAPGWMRMDEFARSRAGESSSCLYWPCIPSDTSIHGQARNVRGDVFQ
jgi:hypothetical protein